MSRDSRELNLALIPTDLEYHFERSGSIPKHEERALTEVHEAAHAVAGVVLRGFQCDYITITSTTHGALIKASRSEAVPHGAEDVVDLSGLYAELQHRGNDKGAWQHLKNATHDLEKALSRLRRENEVAWAKRSRLIAIRFVDYFWGAIQTVAKEVPKDGKAHLEGSRITELVSTHRPTSPTPVELVPLLKPSFVIK